MDHVESSGAARRRLAIIGCGSSGLVTLKYALDELPDWDVVCFEKTDRITGVWGNPYRGFVSTSTKYTTQFSCFPERDAEVELDGGQSRSEFFRNGEYSEYLNRFADAFNLRPHIMLSRQVDNLQRDVNGGWAIRFRHADAAPESGATEHFDAVVICTGLTAQIKQIETPIPVLSLKDLNAGDGIANIRGQRIVVFGGGESAVDYATRLSRPELDNQVFLSLRTGVRVSPRYHPIRGVPSDFLRNRLMLSIHPDMRNWIGQRFVEARMLHQEQFERWFPAKNPVPSTEPEAEVAAARKEWAYRLTKGAKDELFNMFHNKSDDFLDRVARGQITIIGLPVDGETNRFYQFQSQEAIDVNPTRVLPAIGYRSTLSAIAGESLTLADFYLGCVHATYPDLFLVGFARPIIGNIPSISEMQAAYVTGLISGHYRRPADLARRHELATQENQARYSKLDLEIIYPVEMFPYCDYLAREMDLYPSLRKVGSWRDWWRLQLAPATTAHYLYHDDKIRRFFASAPIYMPTLLVMLLLLLKPVDWTFRAIRRLWRRPAAY